MLRRVIISIVLIAVLLGGAAVVSWRLIETTPRPPTADIERPTLLVRAVKVEPRDVVEPILGYGTARADRQTWVAAEVGGEVVAVSPKLHVGVPVDAGEWLVRIDDRDYRQRLEQAQARVATDEARIRQIQIEQRNIQRLIEIARNELDIAERDYKRVMDLFERKNSARREVDLARQACERGRRTLRGLLNQQAVMPEQLAAARASRDLHNADVKLAELALERCEVRAPFRGRIEQVTVDVGQRVALGSRLFALLDPDLIEVPIELPVSVRDRVRPGAACELRLESNPDARWTARVARIAPAADQNTRTFALFVEVDNTTQDVPLMPGMFTKATVAGPTWRGALVVPRGVVMQDHVFVFDHGVARRRSIEVRRHLLDQSIVRGVRPGEVVITSNLDALYDGAAVRLESAGVAKKPERPEQPGAEAAPVGVSDKTENTRGS